MIKLFLRDTFFSKYRVNNENNEIYKFLQNRKLMVRIFSPRFQIMRISDFLGKQHVETGGGGL